MLRFSQKLGSKIDINSLRFAIFNYILSKQLNEKLQIRIVDLEEKEASKNKEKEILELLNLFSIEYETVLFESENLKYHQKLAMQLMSQQKAFSCFCSEEKLKELPRYDGFCSTLSDETVLNCNAPFVVRIKEPNNSSEIDSFIILNHAKMATYNYATAVDDMLYDISMVLHEKKESENTLKQSYIRELLNYHKEIKYISIPNIMDEIYVNDLIEDGFLPSSIANYLVSSCIKTPKEIFSLEESLEWFDINSISKESVRFNIEKLKEINRKHLEMIDDLRFSKILGFADEDIGKLGKLYLNDLSTIKEIKENIDLIFSKKEGSLFLRDEIIKVKDVLKNAPYFDCFVALKEYVQNQVDFEDKKINIAIKLLLTGKENGPDISNIYACIKNYLGDIIK